MAQSTILAAGNTAATSTDITVAAGESVKVGIFTANSGKLPGVALFNVCEDTPGADNVIATLRDKEREYVIAGPGTYRVTRNAYTGRAFGVFLET
jgi:hypothetical protein